MRRVRNHRDVNIIDEIRATASGAATLNDWLGEGGVPVADWQAEARAETCEQCPLNREPFWWEHAKNKIAETVKERLVTKNKMDLRVSNEDDLGICKPCGCVLPLKVWVPIKHIRDHTSPEVFEALPQTNCWLRAELESPK